MVDDLYDYGDWPRAEVAEFVPPVASLLDVGCSGGSFGLQLKGRDPTLTVWGVEARPDLADRAIERLDKVIVGEYPSVIDEVNRTFDCVTFLDVLEHMVDPWEALRATLSLLNPGGCVIASIPNVRNAQIVVPLLRGQWKYADVGLMDRTHLRWFTQASMRDLFESTGYAVDLIEPINLITDGRIAKTLRVFGRLATDLRALQYVVRASPAR